MKHLILALALSTGFLAPKTSQAFVIPGGAAVGMAMAQAGMIGTAFFAFTGAAGRRNGLSLVPWIFPAAAVLGILILDGEGEQEFSYEPLTKLQGTKIGLTAQELRHYNSELDEINATVEYVMMRMVALPEPKLEDSQQVWEEVKGALSPDAFSGLQKVTRQLAK